MRTLRMEIGPDLDGKQVKWVLKNRLHLARGLISRIKLRERGICINGVRARTTDLLHAGDVLTAEVGDPGGDAPGAWDGPEPDVLFEDDDLLIINKPAGMASHGSAGGSATVTEMLAAYLGQSPHLITRLDRGTSGIMVAAKNAYMTERLRRMLHGDSFARRYVALCAGVPDPPCGEIDLPIARVPGSYMRYVSHDGVKAVTQYETLASSGSASLVRLRLLTGRTHQIRVHLAHMGCALVGDAMYGSASPLISRPALHSAELTLIHPLTQARIEMSCRMPDDMSAAAEASGIDLHNQIIY